MKSADSPPAPSFETALTELEGVVDALEKGDMTLEDSLTAFERGIGLARLCQQALETAEQRVRILTDTGPNAEPVPFETHES